MKVYLSPAFEALCSVCNFETGNYIFVPVPDGMTTEEEVSQFHHQNGGLCSDCFAAEMGDFLNPGEQVTIERL